MTSFAFNTMIGQITDKAMNTIGYRYYFLFIICNFTNALFFWAFLPETKKVPLEEMNYLFNHAPIFVPGTPAAKRSQSNDLERRAFSIADDKVRISHVEERLK